MKSWLDNCLVKHSSCDLDSCDRNHSLCGTQSISQLPTRVIDVGEHHRPLQPRLVEGQGRCEIYATLSHCWGQCERTTTTQANIQQMRQAIPIDGLSQTFRDAVIVCRKLKIRYLWIDSVCIIQDSDDDWSREVSKMTTIYKNSHLTIAAVSAANSQQGFLKHRPEGLAGCKLNDTLEDVFIRRERKGWYKELFDAAYQSRAWCFQEQQLPPRIIYFGVEEIIWNCWHGWECEGSRTVFTPFSHGLPWLFSGWKGEKNIKLDVQATGWYEVVEVYSRKHLTFDEDKLPALSGLAAEVQKVTADIYLAGLWQKDLISGLLWSRSWDEPHMVRAMPRRAPSWTWAAYDGSVDMLAMSLVPSADDLARVISSNVKLHHRENPFGRVNGGEIVLRGPCRDFTHEELGRSQDNPHTRLPGIDLPVRPVLDLGPLTTEDHFTSILLRREYFYVSEEKPWYVSDESTKKREVPFELYGLLLRNVHEDMYERAGLITLNLNYVADESTGWHTRTITIV
jgi:hypothetical protein